MEEVSIKMILDAWTKVSESHQQIEEVGFGELADRSDSGNCKYPSVWMESPYYFNDAVNGFYEYSFAFLCLDRAKNDDSDKFTVINKTQQIGTAIVLRFKLEIEKKYRGVEVMPGWDAVSLEDKSDDSASGWRFEFKIKAPGPVKKCDQPFDPFTI